MFDACSSFLCQQIFPLTIGLRHFYHCFQSRLVGLHLAATSQGVGAPTRAADLASRCPFCCPDFPFPM
jgi:hypothetical protein